MDWCLDSGLGLGVEIVFEYWDWVLGMRFGIGIGAWGSGIRISDWKVLIGI